MDQPALYSGPSIIPHVWYPEPKAAVAFLERAFDFRPQFQEPDGNGGVHSDMRAELKIGRGLILVGSANAPRFMFRTPREAGGVNTGAVYTATRDIDALYRRAKDAGAQMVRDLADTDYGSRDFAACDPDGYLWSFGTYHPAIDGSDAAETEAEVFDALRYERPRTAMDWLVEAFGFQRHSIPAVDGEDVRHALLRFGTSLLMISGTPLNDPLKLLPPHLASLSHLGGVHTQVVHVVVADPDAHCERAREAGGEVLEPPSDTWDGARRYIVRDPEGYVWSFSTHAPGQRSKRDKSTVDTRVSRT
ncbi:MAG: VOC family protein [Acidobacteriaceae bacterium]